MEGVAPAGAVFGCIGQGVTRRLKQSGRDTPA